MKPRSSSPIQLAFSCHVNYHQMLPCDGGKFCQSCNQVVHDLTNKSNREILDLLSKQGSICGRVKRSQIQSQPKQKKIQKILAPLFITLGLTGLNKFLFSQDLKFTPELPDSVMELGGAYEETGLVDYSDIVWGVILEKAPEYKYGGEAGMLKFLEDNLIYPKDCIEGKVWVTFAVDVDGKVVEAKIARGISPEADAEVLRVIQMLEFIPGESNGRAKKVNFRMPITFTLK